MMTQSPAREVVCDAPALRTLLAGLIDYAGLFPPAGLTMPQAVANYARYRSGPYAWALGRFVVPASRLAEFDAAAEGLYQWPALPVSTLLANLDADLPVVEEFNHKRLGLACVDAFEVKAANQQQIADLARLGGEGRAVFVEIPVTEDPALLIAAIKSAGLRAKIRTGGLTADMFPPAAIIARFLCACVEERLAFKATAGLHHPVRCVKPFTYEADSARGTMHGFLNVFLAAAMAWKGADVAYLEAILSEEDASAFRFSSDAVEYRGMTAKRAELAAARAEFAIGFGSCSFEEPIQDLQDLGLLGKGL
jgi:hypothetical protein